MPSFSLGECQRFGIAFCEGSLREVIFDITRLTTRLGRVTPNGIDRVDLDYARHYLLNGERGNAALVGPNGQPRLIERQAAQRLVGAVEAAWREPVVDPGAAPLPPPSKGGTAQSFRRAFSALAKGGKVIGRDGLWPARDLIEHAPQHAVFLNVSQFPIWLPRYFDWKRERPDIAVAFFVHDILPIEYPEFFRPFETKRHWGRVTAIAQHADGILVSGENTQRSLIRLFNQKNWRLPPIHIAPLHVAPPFRQEPVQRWSEPIPEPYFLCVGTIEPRKNHVLLLQVWRELLTKLGSATPKLVLVGQMGWDNENVVDLLLRCEGLAGCVTHLRNVATSELITLMRSAISVLMPTFAEGYGLPVAEAIALDVPMIASDIEAFRTFKSPLITRVDPLDGIGWIDTILRTFERDGRKAAPATRSTFDHYASDLVCQWRHTDEFLSGL